MGARCADPLRASELVPVLQKAASSIPGMFAIVTQSSLFQSGLSGGRAIDIEITGPDINRLNQIGQQIFFACMAEFPAEQGHQTTPRSNLESTNPEFHVIPRPVKAADLQVNCRGPGVHRQRARRWRLLGRLLVQRPQD